MDSALKYMCQFVEENRHPSILVDKEGRIHVTNALFRKVFVLKENDNFLTRLAIKQSVQDWKKVMNTISETKVFVLDNLVLSTKENIECICKAHVFYCKDNEQAAVTFVMPPVQKVLPESAYASTFECGSRIIMLVNREGVILDVNNSLSGVFDLNKKDIIGENIRTIYQRFNTHKAQWESIFRDHLKRLKTCDEIVITERFENTPSDIKFFEVRSTFNRESDLYIIEVKDCTETQLLRQQLDHFGSLSTVGQMAASIAHEIRNPMTTLKGFVQLMEATATGDTAKYLSVVDGELQRMEAILNEMLMLSKPSEEKYSEFSLGVLVTKVLEIMKPKATFESIQIDWQDASFCNSMIYSNADKLKQVLLNLFKNSFEAMEPGGILTLKLEKEQDTSYFNLKITDTGIGMSPLQVKNMFIPFFTSKPEGTGLGLPFVLKTMEDLGGSIAVTSEQGIGTTFVLSFPVHCMKGLQVVDHLSAN